MYLELLLLLLLSRFSCVRLCAILQTAAPQAPQSLGFSRQEYWSGVPFPSPMHASMLSHFSRVQLHATLWTAARQAPQSTGFSSNNTGVGCLSPFPLFVTNTCLILYLIGKRERLWDLLAHTPFWAGLTCWVGEGNGTPLQYSCLENPVDWGAW